jgi:hypothetical protein
MMRKVFTLWLCQCTKLALYMCSVNVIVNAPTLQVVGNPARSA